MEILNKNIQIDGASLIREGLFTTHIRFAGNHIARKQNMDKNKVRELLKEQFVQNDYEQRPTINGTEYYFIYWEADKP